MFDRYVDHSSLIQDGVQLLLNDHRNLTKTSFGYLRSLVQWSTQYKMGIGRRLSYPPVSKSIIEVRATLRDSPACHSIYSDGSYKIREGRIEDLLNQTTNDNGSGGSAVVWLNENRRATYAVRVTFEEASGVEMSPHLMDNQITINQLTSEYPTLQ